MYTSSYLVWWAKIKSLQLTLLHHGIASLNALEQLNIQSNTDIGLIWQNNRVASNIWCYVMENLFEIM